MTSSVRNGSCTLLDDDLTTNGNKVADDDEVGLKLHSFEHR
jgi:hypothetical protein